MQPDMVMEKNWAPSFDQCWLQALQFWFIWLIFSAYVSNIMVSLGFRILQWIRLAEDHQTVTLTFFWCKFGFGKCFGVSSWSSHWAGSCQLYTIHFSSDFIIPSRNVSLLCRIREDEASDCDFFDLGAARKYPLLELFHLSNLLQIPSDSKTVNTESFGNFSCRKRISFDDALGCRQFQMAGHCAPPLQGARHLCKTSWTTTALYVH